MPPAHVTHVPSPTSGHPLFPSRSSHSPCFWRFLPSTPCAHLLERHHVLNSKHVSRTATRGWWGPPAPAIAASQAKAATTRPTTSTTGADDGTSADAQQAAPASLTSRLHRSRGGSGLHQQGRMALLSLDESSSAVKGMTADKAWEGAGLRVASGHGVQRKRGGRTVAGHVQRRKITPAHCGDARRWPSSGRILSRICPGAARGGERCLGGKNRRMVQKQDPRAAGSGTR